MLVLQTNLNHHGAAQDLLVQNVAEFGFDLVCISEPASVPRSPYWFGSADGRAAAIFAGSRDPTFVCVSYVIGRNYVAVRCRSNYIFSVYIAPSESDNDFNKTLDELETAIRASGGRCVITGDFNA